MNAKLKAGLSTVLAISFVTGLLMSKVVGQILLMSIFVSMLLYLVWLIYDGFLEYYLSLTNKEVNE